MSGRSDGPIPHRRPVLAPGLRVLRRSRDRLQVGLLPRHRVLLPDTEPVRRTLDRLARGEVVEETVDTDPAARDVLGTLAPVLVDGAALVAQGASAGDVAATALLDPDGFTHRLAARHAATVSVTGSLGEAVDPAPLLAAAGLKIDDGPAPSAVLVLALGEIDREVLDPLVRDGTPHVLVRLVEGTAVLGPFVDPGRTACVRCIDAHRTVDDPRAGVLATRHALARDDRRDGVAEPVDTALATLAVAWAVRDLVTHVDGDRPSTWSGTVELDATLQSVTQIEWLRHPACGCGWLREEVINGAREQASRTMSG